MNFYLLHHVMLLELIPNGSNIFVWFPLDLIFLDEMAYKGCISF